MRISAIETVDAGPLGTQTFDFVDGWSGEVADKILLSGPNGCGKSTLLRGISLLWRAFGHWLNEGTSIIRANHAEYELLTQWKGFACKIKNFQPHANGLILFYGTTDFYNQLATKFNTSIFIGEISWDDDRRDATTINTLSKEENIHFNNWAEEYQRSLVSFQSSKLPNVIFLDAEQRRWINPPEGPCKFIQDNLKLRWSPSYIANNTWENQLEAALISLKASNQERFIQTIDRMNGFLLGKKILKDIVYGENRIQVQISNKAKIHRLDELSSGERQVLIQLYMVERWMEQGGVVLIDEPDLYLHPSLIAGFLAQLEKMVAERNGQLIITSHVPEVWERYESRGMRVQMELQE